MKNAHLAIIYGLATVLLWSTVATAFKVALSFFSPLQLVFIAVISSTLCLSAILIYQKKITLLKQQFLEQPWFYLQTGILNPFLYYLVLFKAYDLLPAQQALSLNYTWAILLPLLSVIFLKQELKISDVIAAILAYLGVVIIATNGALTFESTNLMGIFLALLSTVLWCLYWILNTKNTGNEVVSLLLSFLVSLPLISIALFTTDTLPVLTLKSTLAGVYVGLFEMGITFVLWLLALKKAKRAASVTNLIFLVPVLSIMIVAIVLDETITNATLFGLGMILTALALQKIIPHYLQKSGNIKGC